MEPIRRKSPTTPYEFQNGAGSSASADTYNSAEFDFPKYAGKRLEEFDLESQSQRSSPASNQSLNELFQRRSTSAQAAAAAASGREGEAVVLCSSNASFQRTPILLKIKTKSRLIDPPEFREKISGPLERSGVLNAAEDFDDDDPFLDDDLPDEYKKTNFSCLSMIQVVSLILIVAALVCSLVIPKLKRKTLWELQLWRWGVMVMVLICGGLVSAWSIKLAVFFIERNFVLRKRVLYFVYGLRNAVQKCLWLGWVLLAWNLILGDKIEKKTHGKYLPYITRILICFLVATIIWLLKTLLVKVLAMSFHVTAYFDRIQDALFNQYVIETLSRPPSIEVQRVCDEAHNAGANCSCKNGGIGKSPTFSIDRLHKLNQTNVSAWNMKMLMSAVCNGILSTIDEHLPRSKECSVQHEEEDVHIRSEKQAKSAAKRIFDNVASPGLRYIYEEDLMHFMREDEAMKAMRLFRGSTESEGISKKALKNWVVIVFRERRALALSLTDTKTAVNKLHHLLSVLVSFVILIIWLLILDVSITRFLVFISSQLLLLTFIFGNTIKATFEGIIFLFVMHPFDVGDRIEVDEVQMVVEEINLLTTVFLRYDNQKIIYPNSILATKPISNYNRSPDMGDAIDFCVHISTPVEKISVMKERITRYIENKNDHWYPSPMIVMRDVEDMNRLKFSIWLSHTMNFQDMGERWERRALLVEEIVKVFKDLDIEYRMLPMDVNVRALPSLVSARLPSNWTTCNK